METARILRASSVGQRTALTSQLRYWLRTGLASTARVQGVDEPVLTFDDLVSLELVRRFEACGASLQRVRKLDEELRSRNPEIEHPLAYKVFSTDGAR